MNEYDYSGLYNSSANNSQGTQNVTQPEQAQQAQQPQQPTQQAQAQAEYAQPNTAQASQQTYTATQFTQPQPPKKSSGVGKRIVAGIALVAVCFGVGVGGGYIGSRLNQANVVSAAASAAQSNSQTVVVPTVSNGTDSLTIPEISALVKPSVVSVTTESVQTNSYFGSYVTSGAGSGVIISEDGYIITNAHVVSDARSVSVTMDDATTTYAAQVVGYDTDNDIAVLKIDATGLTPATIGSSSNLVVGEFALAVGNPLGRLGGSVTDGIISALDRSVTVNNRQMTLLQTSAAISPGNSGGGLFNAKGELIGITNAKPNSTLNSDGVFFAIPIDTAYAAAQNIISNKGESSIIMGVTVITVSDIETATQYGLTTPGLYVQSVTTGGGAEAAGIQSGDMLVSMDGTSVATADELKAELNKHQAGDTVEVQLVREKQMVTVSVVLSESIKTVQIS